MAEEVAGCCGTKPAPRAQADKRQAQARVFVSVVGH
jgi:hypothetical protein